MKLPFTFNERLDSIVDARANFRLQIRKERVKTKLSEYDNYYYSNQQPEDLKELAQEVADLDMDLPNVITSLITLIKKSSEKGINETLLILLKKLNNFIKTHVLAIMPEDQYLLLDLDLSKHLWSLITSKSRNIILSDEVISETLNTFTLFTHNRTRIELFDDEQMCLLQLIGFINYDNQTINCQSLAILFHVIDCDKDEELALKSTLCFLIECGDLISCLIRQLNSKLTPWVLCYLCKVISRLSVLEEKLSLNMPLGELVDPLFQICNSFVSNSLKELLDLNIGYALLGLSNLLDLANLINNSENDQYVAFIQRSGILMSLFGGPGLCQYKDNIQALRSCASILNYLINESSKSIKIAAAFYSCMYNISKPVTNNVSELIICIKSNLIPEKLEVLCDFLLDSIIFLNNLLLTFDSSTHTVVSLVYEDSILELLKDIILSNNSQVLSDSIYLYQTIIEQFLRNNNYYNVEHILSKGILQFLIHVLRSYELNEYEKSRLIFAINSILIGSLSCGIEDRTFEAILVLETFLQVGEGFSTLRKDEAFNQLEILYTEIRNNLFSVM